MPRLPNRVKRVDRDIGGLTRTLHRAQALGSLVVRGTTSNIVTVSHRNSMAAVGPTTRIVANCRHRRLMKRPCSVLFSGARFCDPMLSALRRNARRITLRVDFPNHSHAVRLDIAADHVRGARNRVVNTLIVFSSLATHGRARHHVTRTRHLTALNRLVTNITRRMHGPLATVHNCMRVLHRRADSPVRRRCLSMMLGRVSSVGGIVRRLLRFSHPHRDR